VGAQGRSVLGYRVIYDLRLRRVSEDCTYEGHGAVWDSNRIEVWGRPADTLCGNAFGRTVVRQADGSPKGSGMAAGFYCRDRRLSGVIAARTRSIDARTQADLKSNRGTFVQCRPKIHRKPFVFMQILARWRAMEHSWAV
jgi:hypothetical protein